MLYDVYMRRCCDPSHSTWIWAGELCRRWPQHLRVVDPKLREGSAHGGAHSVIDGLRVRVFLAVLHAHRQVQQPVRTELVQHVIQERHVRVAADAGEFKVWGGVRWG